MRFFDLARHDDEAVASALLRGGVTKLNRKRSSKIGLELSGTGIRGIYALRFLGFKSLFFSTVILSVFPSCINQAPTLQVNSKNGDGGHGSLINSKTSSASGPPAQCIIFSNNSRDFSFCLGCVNSLGTGATSNQIAQCVHDNLSASIPGGQCSPPVCGVNQIVDLINCTCQDASSLATTVVTPGQDDTLTPYVEAGFNVTERFCTPSAPTLTITDRFNCLASAVQTNNIPRHATSQPANIYQDLGYIRWDLALDASVFDEASILEVGNASHITQSSVVGNFSMAYKLKPNTAASQLTVNWQDCVEHFSGAGTASSTASTNNFCDPRSSSVTTAAPAASSLSLLSSSSVTGTATLPFLTMNGGTSNKNLITGPVVTGIPNLSAATGLAKLVANTEFPVKIGSGLLSNVGYYKYSFGPLAVRRPNTTTDIASATVSGTVAMNTNLGFSPASAVESTAFSPDAITGTIPIRDCSSSLPNPNPCVVTALSRSSGGAVTFQSFAPRFPNNSSSVGILPDGVIAVSTPKVIEDVSQITSSQANMPARLRAFVRAQDGNVYMSLGQNTRWNSWVNLGRPWTCPNIASSTCQTLITSGLPRVYQPFDTGVSISPNDGISIAGEPVVASYMDTSVSPAKGYIAILARVSQLKSSDGTLGKFHNSVWFTFSATNTTYPTASGAKFDFDKPASWSPWMPIMPAAATYFRTQGNPLAFMKKIGGQVVLYVFGTKLDSGGTPDLHPPVAYVTRPQNATANPVPWLTQRYFNYGNTLIRTSLPLTDTSGVGYTSSSVIFTTAATNNEANAVASLTVGSWNPITAGPTGGQRIFVSDWSYSSLSSSSVRIYANEIYDFLNNCRLLKDGTTCQALANADLNVAPQIAYRRRLHFYEFTLQNSATFTDGSWIADKCTAVRTDGGFYNQIRFIGNVSPVAFNSGPPARDSLRNPGSTSASANSTFIFGRTTCRDKSKCDLANPSAAFATVASASNCDAGTLQANGLVRAAGPTSAGDVMYYAMFSDVAAATMNPYDQPVLTARNVIQPFLVTSDVMAFFSNALDIASTDVPAYLITRDAQGKVTLGTWGSTQSGLNGLPIFLFNPVGGFAN